MDDNFGDEFQRKSKYSRDQLFEGRFNWNSQPDHYKTYPEAPLIQLPQPQNSASQPLQNLLEQRRSVRKFTDESLTIDQLSFLLWGSTGIREMKGDFGFRTAPSAGALYPIETYLLVNNVSEIHPGLYHYQIKNHCLEQLRLGDFGNEIAQAALDQEMVAKAPIVFIWSAIIQRSRWKYHQRCYRYIYLDAGHIAANLTLCAVDLNLGSCQIGAFYDDELNQILGLDGGEETIIYMSVIGIPRSNESI